MMRQIMTHFKKNSPAPLLPSKEESMNNSEPKDYKFSNIRKLRRLIQDNFIMELSIISPVSVTHIVLPTVTSADIRAGTFNVRDRFSKIPHTILLRRIDHSKPIEVSATEHKVTHDSVTTTKVSIDTDFFCTIELLLTGYERFFTAYEDKVMADAREEIEGHFLLREVCGPFY